MSGQCGLSIGSDITSFNLHTSGIVLKAIRRKHTFDTITQQLCELQMLRHFLQILGKSNYFGKLYS